MIFPRPTKRVGNCLAIIVTKKNSPNYEYGEPLLCTDRRPNVKYKGKIWRASRLAYHLNIAHIPRNSKSQKRGMVLHTCDREWCIEPNHLYLGTARQNAIDMFERHPELKQKISDAQMGQPGRNKGKTWIVSKHGRDNMSMAAKKRWDRYHGLS
jgi:hypothetical protein